MAENIETAEFWLTAPKFVQQVGDSEPKYVRASPRVPVKIVLPAKIMRNDQLVDQPESHFMKRIKPAKPKPAHAEVKRELVKKSHETAKIQAAEKAADK